MNQTEVKKRRTSDEEWFKKTEKHLSNYRIWEKRIFNLRLELDNLLPSCTPTYDDTPVSGGTNSDQTGNLGGKRVEIEWEIKEKENKMKQVDTALSLLTEERKAIVMLRFIDLLRDWQIYDLSRIPLGKTLYYTERDAGMEIVAKTLGYLEC